MELLRLELENFRQFYGAQTVEFADGAEENVTVIHGANGSGKTTLLNAFTWLFYDKVTLPKPERVASTRALAEAEAGETVDVAGELVFDHDGTRYTLSRVQTFERDGGEKLVGTQVDEELSMEYVDEFGNTKTRGNPSVSIKQILPERLREMFFFDGETIDKMVAEDQDRVQEAIRNIMGLDILERGKKHLDHVRREFQSEMNEHGSDEMRELLAEQEEIEDEIERLGDELSNTRDSKEKTETELVEVEQRLEKRKESKQLQQRRERLKEDFETKQSEISDKNAEIGELISKEGQLPFALPAVEQTAEMLNEKRQSGEIPSEIKETLVDDLLDEDECICGRSLPDGSEPRQNVTAYRERAGSSDLEEKAMQIAGRLSELASSQESFYGGLDDMMAARSDLKDEERQLKEEIDEISDKLKDDENVGKLEERRERLEEQIDGYVREIGQKEGQIEEKRADLSDVEARINEAEEENELSERARRRVQTAQYLHDRIVQIYEGAQDQVRQSVNDRVNDIYRGILTKDYFIRVNEEYKLEFRRAVKGNPDQTVAVSTGERQVASLSFVASLVSLARERYESDQDSAYFSGGIYPVVMDSPFGALDPEYQEEVSRMVPEMSDQVVVMLTDSQWSDEVSGEMGPRAGREYKLVYHDPSEDGTKYEYTEIRPQTEVA